MSIEQNTPSYYVTEYGDSYDCTGHIGPYKSDSPWNMYSFNSPSYALWNGFASQLNNRGWSDEEIKDYLQSKQTRWLMDGDLYEELEMLGRKYAKLANKIKD
jgi:hypothetical protein